MKAKHPSPFGRGIDQRRATTTMTQGEGPWKLNFRGSFLCLCLFFLFSNSVFSRSIPIQSPLEIQSLLKNMASQQFPSADVTVNVVWTASLASCLSGNCTVVLKDDLPLRGRVVVPIDRYEANRVVEKIYPIAQVDLWQAVAQTTRVIVSGEALSSVNVAFVTENLSELPESVIKDVVSLDGVETKFRIPWGRAILKSMIKPIPLIRPGAVVNIRIQRGRMTVEMKGIAVQEGCAGDVIRVRNEGTRRYMNARVLDRETVVME